MRISEYFKLNRTQPYLDFVDINLATDIPVFIDPVAIRTLDNPFGTELVSLLQSFFDTVLKYVKNGQINEAKGLLASLSEGNEFHLGFSKGRSRGHGMGPGSANSIWDALTNSQAAQTGLLTDLEDSCLLICGIGRDMLSDAVCNILRGPLISYTHDMCDYYGIPMTPGIPSGNIWNPQEEKWESSFTELPVAFHKKIILVPKVLVRNKIIYNYDKYYNDYLLPVMQEDELSKRHSPLVQVLKDGRKKVTKRALKEKYGADKLAVISKTEEKPDVLLKYKDDMKEKSTLPLNHVDISCIQNTETPDWKELSTNLDSLQCGTENATAYENLIEKILSSLFYPSLSMPHKQTRIHNGRKRIDITYKNFAKNGFFYWLSRHYPCPLIFVECKNYGKDVGNPEID